MGELAGERARYATSPGRRVVTRGITFYPDEVDALDRWAEEERVSRSDIVRKIVREALAARARRQETTEGVA